LSVDGRLRRSKPRIRIAFDGLFAASEALCHFHNATHHRRNASGAELIESLSRHATMSNAATLPVSEADAPAKGKGKLFIVLAAVFVLLAAGGGAAWWMHQKPSAEAKEGEDATASKKIEVGKPPVFSTLENFTVNLAGGDHFLQLGIVLQLKDESTAEHVKSYLPQIRNKILLLLSSKTAEDLETPKGKEALIGEILAATREPLHAEGENVQAILLGSMIVQ
jgi:flagellar FliL protein